MGPGMRQVVGFRDRSMGRGNSVGKWGVPHCNQSGVCGAVASSQITFGFLVSSNNVSKSLVTITE